MVSINPQEEYKKRECCFGWFRNLLIRLSIAAISLFLFAANSVNGEQKNDDEGFENEPEIIFWYGDKQIFGNNGTPQRWINILGTIENIELADSVEIRYYLNSGPARQLKPGCDLHRLAGEGDFDADIDRSSLLAGENIIRIELQYLKNTSWLTIDKTLQFVYHAGTKWQLPCTVTWEENDSIQEKVEVIDGHWICVDDGIRTTRAYYDRVIAVGDTSWNDYQVNADITIHGFTAPAEGPPTYNVTHAGIGLRWKGHHKDDHQPHRKWYPLGAATEFTLNADLTNCRWRILPGPGNVIWQENGRTIELGVRYSVKAEVETAENGESYYHLKLWKAGTEEPEKWDLVGIQNAEDDKNGCALIVAHHTDITVHRISVNPL